MRLLSTLIRPASVALVTSRSQWYRRSYRCTALLASAASASPSSSSFSSSSSSSIQQQPSIHSSFADLVDEYDAFILDQFGVLHNGVEALEGAVEMVAYLHAKKKKLMILSNTSAPAALALRKLPKLGFQAEHFVDAVTSGEEASRYIRQKYEEQPVKALFWTWDTQKPNNPRLTAPPQAFLDQCGKNVQVTADIDDADLIIVHGSEVWYRGTDTPQEPLGTFIEDGDFSLVDPLLEHCLQRNLPMVCANPDLVVVTPTGGTAYMPGKIALRYRDHFGASNCRIFGKPDTEHFEACLRKLQVADRARVAHVGDSLSHDIAGAINAGIPNVFVTSGVHASQLGTAFGEMPSEDSLQELFREEGSVYPTHVVSAFRL